MPYPISLGDCIEVRIETTLAGQKCFNVLHYSVSSTGGGGPVTDGQAYLQALAAEIMTGATNICAKMRARQTQAAVITTVFAQKILTPRYRSVRVNSAVTGSIDDTPASPNLSRTLSKLSEIAKRGATGSFHLAGFPQADYTAGVFPPAVAAGDGQLMTAILQSQAPVPGSAVLTPIILQRRPTVAYNNIEGMVSQPTVRVMRRRTVGLGI